MPLGSTAHLYSKIHRSLLRPSHPASTYFHSRGQGRYLESLNPS
jgi:hypothetical protein